MDDHRRAAPIDSTKHPQGQPTSRQSQPPPGALGHTGVVAAVDAINAHIRATLPALLCRAPGRLQAGYQKRHPQKAWLGHGPGSGATSIQHAVNFRVVCCCMAGDSSKPTTTGTHLAKCGSNSPVPKPISSTCAPCTSSNANPRQRSQRPQLTSQLTGS